MAGLHAEFPSYDFATHKGYVTKEHQRALAEHGPCPQHRQRFVNVRRAGSQRATPDGSRLDGWSPFDWEE